MKARTLLATALALSVTFGSQTARAQATPDAPPRVYDVDLKIYNVQLNGEPGEITFYQDGSEIVAGKGRISEALRQNVVLRFEKFHVSDFVTVISKGYNINVILDRRVVKPAPKAAPSTSDGADEDYVTDGIIEYIDLKNVSLEQALKAALIPLGLSYSIESSFIWVSTPEKIASESFGEYYRPSSVFTLHTQGAYVVQDAPAILLGQRELTGIEAAEAANHRMQLLSAPSLRMLEDQEGSIVISDNTPVQYFEPLRDNTYALETLSANGGITTTVRIAGVIANARERTVDLSLKATLVGERTPIEGLSLDVGKPKVFAAEHTGSHALPIGSWASLIGSTQANGALLVFMRVTPVLSAAEAIQAELRNPTKQYRIEARYLRYNGTLGRQPQRSTAVTAMLAGAAARFSPPLITIDRSTYDLRDPARLSRLFGRFDVDLVSDPFVTLLDRNVSRAQDTGYKVVAFGGLQGATEIQGVEEALRRLAPAEHRISVEDDVSKGMGLILSGSEKRSAREDDTNPSKQQDDERIVGALTLVGIDATESPKTPTLELHSQIRFNPIDPKTDDFLAFRDHLPVKFDEPLLYVLSASEDEHYFLVVTVREEEINALNRD